VRNFVLFNQKDDKCGKKIDSAFFQSKKSDKTLEMNRLFIRLSLTNAESVFFLSLMTKSILSAAAISTTGMLAQNQKDMRTINPDAPVRCSKTVVIQADSKIAWAVLTDINNWAAWQTDIRRPMLNGPLQAGTTFDWKTGGAKIHSTLHTVNPYSQFGWTGKTFGMFAIHNWTLTERNGQTTIEVDESMEGFLARLFKPSFNENLEKGMQRWLDLLKQTCEKHRIYSPPTQNL
jgi:hypothetical protein